MVEPRRPLVIDVHSHAIAPYVLNLARNHVVVTGFGEVADVAGF